MKIMSKNTVVFALALAAMSSSALASSDMSSVNGFLTNIETLLKGVAVAVVTIAFMIAGYKVVFGGSTVREVVPIVIGGLIIGAAGYLASLIVK